MILCDITLYEESNQEFKLPPRADQPFKFRQLLATARYCYSFNQELIIKVQVTVYIVTQILYVYIYIYIYTYIYIYREREKKENRKKKKKTYYTYRERERERTRERVACLADLGCASDAKGRAATLLSPCDFLLRETAASPWVSRGTPVRGRRCLSARVFGAEATSPALRKGVPERGSTHETTGE